MSVPTSSTIGDTLGNGPLSCSTTAAVVRTSYLMSSRVGMDLTGALVLTCLSDVSTGRPKADL